MTVASAQAPLAEKPSPWRNFEGFWTDWLNDCIPFFGALFRLAMTSSAVTRTWKLNKKQPGWLRHLQRGGLACSRFISGVSRCCCCSSTRLPWTGACCWLWLLLLSLFLSFSSPDLSCFQLEKEQGAGIGQAVGGNVGVGGGKKEQKGKKSPGNYHRG